MPQSLEKLPVLILDIQASGAMPERDQLLEVGWAASAASRAASRLRINTRIAAPADAAAIPRRVLGITGITTEELQGGVQPAQIWKSLRASAKAVAGGGGQACCPTVIHYSRFEEPWLRWLHRCHGAGAAFPFDLICTHQIGRRLLPGLPRAGLRAIAGYFGLPVDQLRRSGHHVEATAYVWSRLVTRLSDEMGIDSLDALKAWLEQKAGRPRVPRQFAFDTARLKQLPDGPGIYRMVAERGAVLYVGKALSLRKRVSSYFRNKGGHGEHILEMLSQVKDVQVQPAASALEAALAESDEIKRLSPPYNRALQKANRTVAFFSRDLTCSSPRPSRQFPIGPIPGAETLCVLPRIVRMLADGCRGEAGGLCAGEALQLPPQYAPDPESLIQGLALFREKYAGILQNTADVRGLLKIGHELWRQRIAAGEEPAEGEPEPEEETTPAEFVWTAEAVVHLLESIVQRCGMYLRRGRLFRLLSQATIVWRAPDGERRNLLVVAAGAIRRSASLAAARAVPPPPGATRRFHSRGSCFDLATYDRMRVLTSEIRRIVNAGREMQVRTGRAAPLDSPRLKKLLSWI